MENILKKLRNYEIQIRKKVHSQMSGEYSSVFKGTGLEFDDIRVYQYGDDVRRIDWKTSAKGQETYIKTYKEEKDQSVYFLLDVSASQEMGPNNSKLLLAKEILGTLAIAASRQNSNIGLYCFSDQTEKYIKPKKGQKHQIQIINNVFDLKPTSTKTDLNFGFKQALSLIPHTSLIFVLSDFIDEDYEHYLKALASKHDLIIIRVEDASEKKVPRFGVVPIRNTETKKINWINTSFGSYRKKQKDYFNKKNNDLMEFSKKHQIDYLTFYSDEDIVPKLSKLFINRNKIWKRG